MPTDVTPRHQKHASASSSRLEKSRKSRCTISRSFGCVLPLAERNTANTSVTSGSPRHSRRTPWPTMPVAPKRMIFIRDRDQTPISSRCPGAQSLIEQRPRAALDREQFAFGHDPAGAGESDKLAVRAHHAVAGHHEREWVSCQRDAHGARRARIAKLLGDLAV